MRSLLELRYTAQQQTDCQRRNLMHCSLCDSARLNRICTHDQVNSMGFDSIHPCSCVARLTTAWALCLGLTFVVVSSLVTLLVNSNLSFSHLL